MIRPNRRNRRNRPDQPDDQIDEIDQINEINEMDQPDQINQMNQIYICVTGDIIGSSEQAGQRLMDLLEEGLQEVNRSFSPVVRFSISSGDEFQGLLTLEQNPFSIIESLEYGVLPFRFRVGLGVGTVATGLLETTHAMQGKAFELARAALLKAKREDRLYALEIQPPRRAYDAVLMLLSFIKKNWRNEKVFRRYRLYRLYGSIDRVAELEGVSRQAINKMIRNYGFRQVIQATEELFQALREELKARS